MIFLRFMRIIRNATKNVVDIAKVKIIANTIRIILNSMVPVMPNRIKSKSNINAIVANINILFKLKLLSIIWFHLVL